MNVMRRVRLPWRLVGALGAVIVLGAGLFVSVAPAGADSSHVEGSYWLDAQSSVDHHSFHVVTGLASGGVITSIVSDDPATEVGQWSLDDNKVVATFYSFAVAPTGPVGTVKVHITAKLREDRLTGTYTATGTTTAGGPLFPPDHGTFSGKRIKAGD
jgi:hypothetical protein